MGFLTESELLHQRFEYLPPEYQKQQLITRVRYLEGTVIDLCNILNVIIDKAGLSDKVQMVLDSSKGVYTLVLWDKEPDKTIKEEVEVKQDI